MTQALQLLVIAGSLVGLVIYGLIRDRQEHSIKSEPGVDQQSIHFPDQVPNEKEPPHRGAAMSRF